MLTAPSAGGPFVGDYDGLTPAMQSTTNLFESAFVMAQPQATNGPTDLFANGTQ